MSSEWNINIYAFQLVSFSIRVRPSPNISLIIELQASGGYDPYGQEVSRLIPRGWVKVDIFDYQNRVISGQWKVPIRTLPVKPSLTSGALNGVPQVTHLILCSNKPTKYFFLC